MRKGPIAITAAWGLICPRVFGFGFNATAEFPNPIGAGGNSLSEDIPCFVTGLGSQQEPSGDPNRCSKQKTRNQQTSVVILIHLAHPHFLSVVRQ